MPNQCVLVSRCSTWMMSNDLTATTECYTQHNQRISSTHVVEIIKATMETCMDWLRVLPDCAERTTKHSCRFLHNARIQAECSRRESKNTEIKQNHSHGGQRFTRDHTRVVFRNWGLASSEILWLIANFLLQVTCPSMTGWL